MLLSFLRFFANPLVVILLVASVISIALHGPVGGLIIIAMVLLSLLLNFFMDSQARHAVEAIRKQVATTAAVVRDGQKKKLPIADLVPGDIVKLNAGDLVPADARLLDVKDLQVRESAPTGESLPVGKVAGEPPKGTHNVTEASNSVFVGTAVQTGAFRRHRRHRMRHGLRRDRPVAGGAAAGDRVRSGHPPHRADDHAGHHGPRPLRPAGQRPAPPLAAGIIPLLDRARGRHDP